MDINFLAAIKHLEDRRRIEPGINIYVSWLSKMINRSLMQIGRKFWKNKRLSWLRGRYLELKEVHFCSCLSFTISDYFEKCYTKPGSGVHFHLYFFYLLQSHVRTSVRAGKPGTLMNVYTSCVPVPKRDNCQMPWRVYYAFPIVWQRARWNESILPRGWAATPPSPSANVCPRVTRTILQRSGEKHESTAR